MLPLLLFLSVTETPELANHPHRVSDEELYAALDLDRNGLEAVREAVGRGDYARAGAEWATYFRGRLRPTPHFSRDVWPDFIRETFPQLAPPMIAEAECIVSGRVAHGPFVLQVDGREINWTANPKRDTNYVSVVGSQWFMNYLGRAYLLTGDEKYADAFAWLFGSWYDSQEEILREQGGLGFGTVYRAYYPGIRTRVLTDNYYCFAASPALTPGLHVKVMKQLLGSCAWLHSRNAGYQPGNQQVAAMVGLGITGMVFPEFKDAAKWVERARARMTEHLRQDFFEDGGHSELCTQYHKTCLRDFGYLALTAEKNGLPSFFSSEDGPVLERAYDWLARLVMPTGETPALHSAVFATDWAVHLTAAERYFERPDFAWLARRFWNTGQVPSQKGPVSLASFMVSEAFALPSVSATAPPSAGVHLESSGFAVLRTGWESSSRYCVFQYGWPKSSHAYPGALSFILEMNGELVATHPGSPRSYRHPAYEYCHSTRAHNLVTIDLADHALNRHVAPGGKLVSYVDMPGAWYVRGRHDGYQDAFGASHERSMLMVKDGPVLVRDRIVGGQGHTAHWSLHSPLGVGVGEDRVVTLRGNRAYRVCPSRPEEITAIRSESHWMAVLPSECQPGDCGKEVPVVRFEKPIGPGGVGFCMAIIEGDGEVVALGPNAVRVHTPAADYIILYADGGTVQASGVTSDAECVCVRLTNATPDVAWLVNGTALSVEDKPWLEWGQPFSGEVVPDQLPQAALPKAALDGNR